MSRAIPNPATMGRAGRSLNLNQSNHTAEPGMVSKTEIIDSTSVYSAPQKTPKEACRLVNSLISALNYSRQGLLYTCEDCLAVGGVTCEPVSCFPC